MVVLDLLLEGSLPLGRAGGGGVRGVPPFFSGVVGLLGVVRFRGGAWSSWWAVEVLCWYCGGRLLLVWVVVSGVCLGCCVVWFTCLGVVLVWWSGLGLGQQAGRQRVPGMNPRKGIRMFDLHAAEAQVREAAEAVRSIAGMPVTQVDVHQVLQVEENVATQVVITGRYTKDVFVSGAVFGYGNPVLVGRQVDRVEESSVFAGGAFYWSVKAFDAQGDLVFEISGEGVDWEVRSR